MVLEDWFGLKLRTVNIILPILGIVSRLIHKLINN